MQLNFVTAIISILLFFIMFFGIGFISNMLFRRTYVMATIYPIIALYFIGQFSLLVYFTDPKQGFSYLTNLKILDVVVLLAGFLGAMVSGTTTKFLRNRGFQMF